MFLILKVIFLAVLVLYCHGFRFGRGVEKCYRLSPRSAAISKLNLIPFPFDSLNLADISVTEEEVLDVVGQASTLPSPWVAVGFAAVVFAAVAVLQFSLGDLTKEVSNTRLGAE